MQIQRTQNQPNFKMRINIEQKANIVSHLSDEQFQVFTKQMGKLRRMKPKNAEITARMNPHRLQPFTLICNYISIIVTKENLSLQNLAQAGKQALREARAESNSVVIHKYRSNSLEQHGAKNLALREIEASSRGKNRKPRN